VRVIRLSKFNTKLLSILISYQNNQEPTGRLLITRQITESKLNNQPTLVPTPGSCSAQNLFIKNLTVNQMLQLGKKGLKTFTKTNNTKERERERERELMKEYSINQFTLKQTNKQKT
jgi:hypothetical protein